jgi:isopentenyldiphosphate isomerase
MKIPDSEELFPIVDEDGNTIGETPRNICHDGVSRLLHPVVHLHIFNSKGELFLQKRAMTKDIQPGKWDTSVGGHMSPGESIAEALQREADEELGLKKFDSRFLGRYVWESPRERELVNSYLAFSDEIPLINSDEIEEGKFWSIKDIKKNIGKDVFTPNFENEFEMMISSDFLPPPMGLLRRPA